MTEPWLNNVRGDQVLPLINLNKKIIRVEAGPGTGKTFGLVRRVQRILHPDGLNVQGKDVLVVAFNRVIARQLQADISECLKTSEHDGEPRIRTVHALCLEVINQPLRILMEHERDAMLYDVREAFPSLKETYKKHKDTEQALAEHEAKIADHPKLWQAVKRWLTKHGAQLISELPALLLSRIRGGDFKGEVYDHVVVDEFQDLTPAEQQLFFALRKRNGSLVVLGDPRQSIYAFRGNDRQGLSKLEALISSTSLKVNDVPMTECQRCPEQIVMAANRLMILSAAAAMSPGSSAIAETYVLTWSTPRAEAKGIAKALVDSIAEHPMDKHLVMVTRRNFGYWLRHEIKALNKDLKVDLNFSESLLETWPVREAFLYFCLRADPDAPTWRAWLGYQAAPTGKAFVAAQRNAGAYLKLLKSLKSFDGAAVEAIAGSDSKPQGGGGKNVKERSERFVALNRRFEWNGKDAREFIDAVLADDTWITDALDDRETPAIDMEICRDKTRAMLQDLQQSKPGKPADFYLKEVAQSLRYQIATREPFIPEEKADIQVATLWGAKGITADRVFILGLCEEAIPGARRPEYPGDDDDYLEEQRRLFYVSITRSKNLLVLSRALSMSFQEAASMGLQGRYPKTGFWTNLESSQFLQEIEPHLPGAIDGDEWLEAMLVKSA